MTAHSSILAWRVPWTEERGRLQFIGSQRVGHDISNFSKHARTKQLNLALRIYLDSIKENSRTLDGPQLQDYSALEIYLV